MVHFTSQHDQHGCFQKLGDFPPKWMVKIMENLIKMDNLGVPVFLETPTCLFECSKDESETLPLPKKNSIRSDSARILEQSHRPKRRKVSEKTCVWSIPFLKFESNMLVSKFQGYCYLSPNLFIKKFPFPARSSLQSICGMLHCINTLAFPSVADPRNAKVLPSPDTN